MLINLINIIYFYLSKNNVIINVYLKFYYKGCLTLENKNSNLQTTEKLGFGMLLASTGGFMDAYSYLVHGNVFATGQTGNFVLVAVNLAKKNYINSLHSLVPIISFWFGIFISLHMLNSLFKERQALWHRATLVIVLIVILIAGFVPHSYPDLIANTLVSFAASLQYCAFRKFGVGENYASIFCTGNMRSCAENYYKGIIKKDKPCFRKALRYSCILISFFIGAITCALESKVFHEMSIWSVDIIILSVLVFSYIFNRYNLKNSLSIEEEQKAV